MGFSNAGKLFPDGKRDGILRVSVLTCSAVCPTVSGPLQGVVLRKDIIAVLCLDASRTRAVPLRVLTQNHIVESKI